MFSTLQIAEIMHFSQLFTSNIESATTVPTVSFVLLCVTWSDGRGRVVQVYILNSVIHGRIGNIALI